ncbi:hypothetical protein POVWA2_059160 [Plasmodium ovale wallikeri]|uniref:Uncharacterized protein n=1 Tax=Plasmodium ovale wallikeri TaxID=864142 RepID=A0A1A9A199_PLAOA|nr:hypothetical protein POVWA2_059160 [Plasmodium ovale wallikeri]
MAQSFCACNCKIKFSRCCMTRQTIERNGNAYFVYTKEGKKEEVIQTDMHGVSIRNKLGAQNKQKKKKKKKAHAFMYGNVHMCINARVQDATILHNCELQWDEMEKIGSIICVQILRVGNTFPQFFAYYCKLAVICAYGLNCASASASACACLRSYA